ncbi:MAG TPA: hypothetical protein VJ576_03425 [Rhodocyclaceae bacterium]|nr:hypothetical protein [Rhodocyclaceae bacterium]
MQTNTTTPHVEQHWQDFERPVTIQPGPAGSAYRAIRSIKATLRMVADHQLRANSGGVQPLRLSPSEVDAMLAGALALSQMVEEMFEDQHS